MNLLHKYMIFCAVVFMVVPVVLSTVSSDNITATDWVYRHTEWISRYIHGNFTPILEYPPLFHWLMLPFVFLNFPMKYFQIVFSILSAFGILYMAYRLENEKSVLYVAILLASSIAYVEFSGALMPQSLDYLLFPLAIIFYYQDKVKYCVPLLVIDFFMHGIGFIFIGILFLHSLLTKRFKYTKIFLILLVALSFIFYYYIFMATMTNHALAWDWEAQLEWDSQILNPFWKFFAFSGFLAWILLPYGIYRLKKENFKLTDSQLLYVIWILAFLIFIPFHVGLWRMISYQIVPLSLLIASLVSKK